MSYTPTQWRDNATPDLDAAALNHMEQGIAENDRTISGLKSQVNANEQITQQQGEEIAQQGEQIVQLQQEVEDLEKTGWETERSKKMYIEYTTENGYTITDSDIAPIKGLSAFGKSYKSPNLWNPKEEVVGWYDKVTNTIKYDTAYKSVEKIPITNQTSFTISGHYVKSSGGSGRTWVIVAYLDAGGNHISSTAGYTPASATTDAYNGIVSRTLEVPSGAKYVTASVGVLGSGAISDCMLAEGNNTDYEPYGIHSVENEEIVLCGENLLNPYRYSVQNAWLDFTDVITTNSAPNDISDYIRVKPDTTYTLGGNVDGNASSICWYDEHKNYINGTRYIERPQFNVAIPSNGAYVRLTIIKSYADNMYFVEGSNQSYEPYNGCSADIPYTLRGIGDVRDSVELNTYRNMKSVDLGSLTWVYKNGGWYAENNAIADIVKPSSNDIVANIISSEYEIYTWSKLDDNCKQLGVDYRGIVYCQNFSSTEKPSGILHYEATSGGEDYTTYVLTRRIGSVDLGSFTWEEKSMTDNRVCYTTPTGSVGKLNIKYDSGSIPNMICSNHEVTYSAAPRWNVGEIVAVVTSSIANHNSIACIETLGKYASASAFKEAMNGAELQYEFVTPTTIEVSVDDSQLQTYYPTTNIEVKSESGVVGEVCFDYMALGITPDAVFLTAPNGTRYLVTVDDAGQLTATPV